MKTDADLYSQLPEDFDVSQVDISDVRIDAHNLATVADRAQYRGVEAIKRYFAIKAAFERQQVLIAEENAKPKESHAPAITSQSIKPVNAN